LTSDVFGLMSYFPYDSFLRPFLENISARNPNSHFSVPPIEPINEPCFWERINWPENLPKLRKKRIEPDVIIEWDDTLLFVESKFVLPTEPEELLREFLVGTSQASTQKHFFLLLIDKNLSPSNVSSQEDSSKIPIPEYLERRLKKLRLPNDLGTKVSNSFLWINWQSVYLLIEEFLRSKLNLLEKRILSDLIKILQRKGVIPFEELNLEFFENRVIDLPSLGEIGVRVRKQYSDFPDISIDLNVFDNIGIDMDNPLASLSQFNIDAQSLEYLSAGEITRR